MKLSLLTAAALASTVLALPIEKRAVVTDFVHVTRLVYENAHIFVDQFGNAVSTSFELVSTGVPAAPVTSTIIVPTPTPAPSSKTTITSTIIVTLASSTAQPEPTSAPPPPPTSTPAPPPPETSTPPPPPPPPSTSTPPPPETSTPPPPPPPETSTPPPPPPASSAAPAPASTSSSSGPGEFSGQATFYAPGLGACGITNTASDFIAALNAPMFGNVPNPNDNPNCGKKAQIWRNGKTVTVTIVDKCPTCASGNLDLSPAAFDVIAEPAEGRVEITWSWV